MPVPSDSGQAGIVPSACRAAGLAASGQPPVLSPDHCLPHNSRSIQGCSPQNTPFLFHTLTLHLPFSTADKLKDSVLPTPKPIQHPLHPPPGSHHPVPSLIPNHSVFPLPGSSAATALLIHRTNEEEKWLARQRRLRQEKEDRQSQVSEFRQQVLEQHLDIGRAPSQAEPEHRPEHPR